MFGVHESEFNAPWRVCSCLFICFAQSAATPAGVVVQQNAALGEFHLPKLQVIGGDVRIYSNDRLENMMLPALHSCRSLSVVANPGML